MKQFLGSQISNCRKWAISRRQANSARPVVGKS